VKNVIAKLARMAKKTYQYILGQMELNIGIKMENVIAKETYRQKFGQMNLKHVLKMENVIALTLITKMVKEIYQQLLV
jgi:hypothetical protein